MEQEQQQNGKKSKWTYNDRNGEKKYKQEPHWMNVLQERGKELNEGEFKVLFYLFTHTFYEIDGYYIAWPGQNTLAEECGMGETAIPNIIRRLIQKAWIVDMMKSIFGDSIFVHNTYELSVKRGKPNTALLAILEEKAKARSKRAKEAEAILKAEGRGKYARQSSQSEVTDTDLTKCGTSTSPSEVHQPHEVTTNHLKESLKETNIKSPKNGDPPSSSLEETTLEGSNSATSKKELSEEEKKEMEAKLWKYLDKLVGDALGLDIATLRVSDKGRTFKGMQQVRETIENATKKYPRFAGFIKRTYASNVYKKIIEDMGGLYEYHSKQWMQSPIQCIETLQEAITNLAEEYLRDEQYWEDKKRQDAEKADIEANKITPESFRKLMEETNLFTD